MCVEEEGMIHDKSRDGDIQGVGQHSIEGGWQFKNFVHIKAFSSTFLWPHQREIGKERTVAHPLCCFS